MLNDLPSTKWILVDDTDREDEKLLLSNLVKFFQPLKLLNIISKSKRQNGMNREAVIIKVR